jgi:hypothetical protein
MALYRPDTKSVVERQQQRVMQDLRLRHVC